MRWRVYPRLSRQSQSIHKGSSKGEEEAGEAVSVWCDMRKTWPEIASFEGQLRHHQPRNVGSI